MSKSIFCCSHINDLDLVHCRNGDWYSGEYFGDKIHGFGVYNFANGHCYEGSWHEGRRQGFGTYTFRNGERRSGEWDCGVLKNSLLASDPVVERVLEVCILNLYGFPTGVQCTEIIKIELF